MKKPRNKIAYLLAGIFIGVLIAFSIVWWQSNNIGGIGLFKKTTSFFSSFFSSKNSDVTLITEDSETVNKKNNYKNLDGSGLRNDSAYYDSTNIDLYDPNALDEFLARYNGKLPDSLVIDSILKSQQDIDINSYSTTNPVEVKKDRLIFAKTYIISGSELFSSDNDMKLDSLLTDNNTAGQQKTKNAVRVEFWKSPINYKGYKTGKNKLILFGVDQFDMVSFKVVNKSLYLKYLSDFYHIERTNDFTSLIPVNNPQLYNQLNSK